MATRKALTDLSWNGISFKAGKEFDDKDIPASVLKGWEESRVCSKLPVRTEYVKPAAPAAKEK